MIRSITLAAVSLALAGGAGADELWEEADYICQVTGQGWRDVTPSTEHGEAGPTESFPTLLKVSYKYNVPKNQVILSIRGTGGLDCTFGGLVLSRYLVSSDCGSVSPFAGLKLIWVQTNRSPEAFREIGLMSFIAEAECLKDD